MPKCVPWAWQVCCSVGSKLPIFFITGGTHNSDRQICKDITVNDAPAFWLQATAIKIPLSKSKDHQLCTFIHTTMLRNSLR